MRMTTFAKRCAKEILRDPINLGFGLGFPVYAIIGIIPMAIFNIALGQTIRRKAMRKDFFLSRKDLEQQPFPAAIRQSAALPVPAP